MSLEDSLEDTEAYYTYENDDLLCLGWKESYSSDCYWHSYEDILHGNKVE